MLLKILFHLQNNTLLRRYKHFVKKTFFTTQYDKRVESDQQMLQRVGKKFAALILFILLFDTLLDWFLGLLDIVFHLVHLLIETIEYSLELLLVSTLNTNPQQSETIIVNSVIIIALYLAYQLMLAAPQLTMRFKRNCRAAWLRHIRRETSCWQSMSLNHKIKWVGAYSFGTICLLLFIT